MDPNEEGIMTNMDSFSLNRKEILFRLIYETKKNIKSSHFNIIFLIISGAQLMLVAMDGLILNDFSLELPWYLEMIMGNFQSLLKESSYLSLFFLMINLMSFIAVIAPVMMKSKKVTSRSSIFLTYVILLKRYFLNFTQLLAIRQEIKYYVNQTGQTAFRLSFYLTLLSLLFSYIAYFTFCYLIYFDSFVSLGTVLNVSFIEILAEELTRVLLVSVNLAVFFTDSSVSIVFYVIKLILYCGLQFWCFDKLLVKNTIYLKFHFVIKTSLISLFILQIFSYSLLKDFDIFSFSFFVGVLTLSFYVLGNILKEYQKERLINMILENKKIKNAELRSFLNFFLVDGEIDFREQTGSSRYLFHILNSNNDPTSGENASKTFKEIFFTRVISIAEKICHKNNTFKNKYNLLALKDMLNPQNPNNFIDLSILKAGLQNYFKQQLLVF